MASADPPGPASDRTSTPVGIGYTSTVDTSTNFLAVTWARWSSSVRMPARSAAGSAFAFHFSARTPAQTTVS